MHGKRGGFIRSFLRHERYQEAANRAEEELRMFNIGEPSEAFFPQKKSKSRRTKERGTIATAQDIQNRIREQQERYVEYEHYAGHPGNLTMPWRRFGVKYRKQIQELKG